MESRETLPGSRIWDLYFGGRTVCVLDIETTGLDRRRCAFVLGGLYDPQAGRLYQVFADRIEEEHQALSAFLDIVSRYDVAVTYNGRHFDLPFLEERIRRTGAGTGSASEGGVGSDTSSVGMMPAAVRSEQTARRTAAASWDGYDLDIYQVVNGHSPIRRLLPNLRQKTLESYMGLWSDRADEISGAESVELYYHYMKTGDGDARRRILLHNSDDVMQLTRLVRVLDKCDLHRAMYRMGFPAGSPRRRWQVTRIRSVGDQLLVEGRQGADRMEYRGYGLGEFPMQTRFNAKAGTFQIQIPLVRQSGIAAADLQAAGLPQEEFQKYPDFGSGFLVLEDPDGVKYRETNHLVMALLRQLEESV